MKKIFRYVLMTGLFIMLPGVIAAQECTGYHTMGDCIMDLQKGYDIYSQSKSAAITALDTIEFNIIFYGQKDYVFSFCTHRKLYPVNFRLIDPGTNEIVYDNSQDNYVESLGIGFDVTRPMKIQINVLGRKATEEELEDYAGCVGLLIQYKNYPEKKVKLQM